MIRMYLEQQGYDLDDDTARALAPWLRMSPLICSAGTLAATLSESAWPFFMLATLGLVASAVGRHPLEWVADRTLRREAARALPIPLAETPRRFAYAVSTSGLVVAGSAFLAGLPVLAMGLGVTMTTATGVAAATDLCAVCTLWHLWMERDIEVEDAGLGRSLP